MSLSVGDQFPEFELQDDNGDVVRSSDLKGKRVVMFFYPKDNTAGCTREAKEFSEVRQRLEDKGILLFGVSKDSVKSHRNFIDKQELDVRLLSDPEHVLMEQVGAWGPKISYGRMTVGAIRSTFVIGEDGRVENVWRNVRVPGHVENVVDSLLG
ncbi:MAG: peroxiredoxin [Candidatus Methanomethylophilaceae archaeon]|nr:peroxiredoxin [Candidatus Methanomethylophilaceae archaeon]